MDTQFATIVEEATAGLRDDPELCLDVRAELAGHLQAAVEEHLAEGKSEEESRELAARTFGSPVEVAGALLEANRPRLRLRALLRLTVRALLIPAALVVALWCVFGRVWHSWDMFRYNPFNASSQQPLSPDESTLAAGKGTSFADVKAFLDATDNNPDRLKRYWETHRNEPDSKIYYARYAVLGYSNVIPNNEREMADFEQVMHLGEQLDPDNGLYNFYLASAYLHKGMIARTEQPFQKGKIYTDDLFDRDYLEKGLAEWRKGLAKSRFTSYAAEMTQQRLAVLPHPRFIEDYLWRMGISARVLFPDLAEYRELARQIGGSERLLAAQGRRDEAEALAASWQPFTMRMTGGACTLIHVLVVNAVTAIMSQDAAKLYQQLGRPDLAEQTRERAQQFTAGIDAFKAQRSQIVSANEQQYGSRLAWGVLSVEEQPPTREQLAPSRTVEQTLLEEVTVLLLLLFLTIAMLGSIIEAAHWTARLQGAKSTPLLLLPPARVFARIFIYGVALPLMLYFIYTHLPVIGGREYALSYMWPRFFAEAIVLLLVLLYLPVVLANRYIRQRCASLGVSLPAARKERRSAWAAAIAGLLGTVLWLGFVVLLLKSVSDGYLNPAHFCISMAVLLAGAYLMLRLRLHPRNEHALYYGTVARSQAAVYALTIILIAAVPQTYLRFCEINALQRDQLVFQHERNTCTPAEDRTVQQLRTEMLQVAEKWGEGKAVSDKE